MGGPLHTPVLLRESLELLAVKPGGIYADGTVGLGGHAEEILRRSTPGGILIGVDRDAEALAVARARLAVFDDRVRLQQAPFALLPQLGGALRPDGILLDLGVSSLQLDTPARGFSFRAKGPLDMRMDPSQHESAWDVVNRTSETELADLIYRFGEDRHARRIARAIVAARRRAPIETTLELAELVRRAVPRSRAPIHPATRTFQALRIRVNHELEGLADTLRALAAWLAPGGRLVVIAFHSLEDREVKHVFRELAGSGFGVLTRKPLRPSAAEASANPRARSARLRGLLHLAEAA